MLTLIAGACIVFGWICAASLARRPLAQFAAHLAGVALVAGFVGMLLEEAALRERIKSAEFDAQLRRTLGDVDRTLEAIRTDERRLRELCAQYPGTQGC